MSYNTVEVFSALNECLEKFHYVVLDFFSPLTEWWEKFQYAVLHSGFFLMTSPNGENNSTMTYIIVEFWRVFASIIILGPCWHQPATQLPTSPPAIHAPLTRARVVGGAKLEPGYSQVGAKCGASWDPLGVFGVEDQEGSNTPVQYVSCITCIYNDYLFFIFKLEYKKYNDYLFFIFKLEYKQ